MALFNEILSGRFNRALQKLLGMKGPPAVPQLSGELMAAISMFYGAEARYLEGWNRFGSVTTVGGAVGNKSAVQIRNPTNSGAIAVIERILFAAFAVDSPIVSTGAATTDLAGGSSSAIQLDTRSGGPGGACAVSLQNTTAAPSLARAILQTALAANTNYDFVQYTDDQLTILPGAGYMVAGNVANQSITVSLIWRERILEDSEKS